MKHDDTKVTPLSRYLNDSTLGQLVVADGLMGLGLGVGNSKSLINPKK